MKPKKEVNLLLLIGILLAAIAVVVGIVLFAGPKDQMDQPGQLQQNDQQSQSAPTEATTVPTEPVDPKVLFDSVGTLQANEITDSKSLIWSYQIENGNELSKDIILDFLPNEAIPTAPNDVRYIVNVKYRASRASNYIGLLQVFYTSIQAEVIDVITGEKIAEENFPGEALPEQITSKESKYYAPYPDDALVQEWAQKVLKDARAQKLQEIIETVDEYVTSHALSYADALESLDYLGTFSAADVDYARDYIAEKDNVTDHDEPDAGQDEAALKRAKKLLDLGTGYSPKTLNEQLVQYYSFTKEQAAYAVENCGADWNAEALKVAKYFLDIKMGYSHDSMILVLVHDYGFTEKQAQYAADNCNADWFQVAVDHVNLFLEYSQETYTREQMIDEMVNYYDFTMEQAVYAVDTVGLK